jgi:hypothetical protein
LVINFFFKENINKKRRRRNQATAKMWWSDHPVFGQGVAEATPKAGLGVVEPPL